MKIVTILNPKGVLASKYGADVVRLHNELFQDQRLRLHSLNGRKGFSEISSLDDLSNDVVSLAVEDGRGVGFISYGFHRNNGDTWLDLFNVYVEPGSRGKGIFKALYSSVETFAKEKGCKWVSLSALSNNLPALSLYLKLGFRTEFKDMVKEL